MGEEKNKKVRWSAWPRQWVVITALSFEVIAHIYTHDEHLFINVSDLGVNASAAGDATGVPRLSAGWGKNQPKQEAKDSKVA